MKTNTYGYTIYKTTTATFISVYEQHFIGNIFFRSFVCSFPLLYCCIQSVYTCIVYVCMGMYTKQCSSVRSVRWCHSDAIFVCGIVCCCYLLLLLSNYTQISNFQFDRSTQNQKYFFFTLLNITRTDIDLLFIIISSFAYTSHFV